MGSLEEHLGLVKATEEETKKAANYYLSSRFFKNQGCELFFGRQFGTGKNRNQFWKGKDEKFFLDYSCNLVDNLSSSMNAVTLSVTGPASTEGQSQMSELVLHDLTHLKGYLHEDSQMLIQGLVPLSGQIQINSGEPTVSNREMLWDILRLKMKLSSLYSVAEVCGIETEPFNTRAKDFINVYWNVVRPKYKGNGILM